MLEEFLKNFELRSSLSNLELVLITLTCDLVAMNWTTDLMNITRSSGVSISPGKSAAGSNLVIGRNLKILKYISDTSMYKVWIWLKSFLANIPVLLLVDGQQCSGRQLTLVNNKNDGKLAKRDFNLKLTLLQSVQILT